MIVMIASVTAADPAVGVVGVAASAVGEGEAEEWSGEEGDLAAALAVLRVDAQMGGHLCHPMLPTLDHLSSLLRLFARLSLVVRPEVYPRPCSRLQRSLAGECCELVDASLVELQKERAALLHSALEDWPQMWEVALRQVVLCGEVQC